MPAGFAFGTTITTMLRVKTTGLEHSPFARSWFGSFMSAEAKTSAGAPCSICAASVFEPPKEYLGAASILGKTSVSDAAAYTVSCTRAAPSARAASAARPMQSARRAVVATSARRLRMGTKRSLLPSALEDHVGRLDDRGRRHPVLEPELFDRVSGHDRDEAHRVADDDLDLGHQPVHLHVGHDSVEAVARADVRALTVAADAVELGRCDDTPITGVALHLGPARPVPAPERVEAD